MSDGLGELTVVIPAKNEAAMLPRLLASLAAQDYIGLAGTRVLVADAGSSDGTAELALGFGERLRIEVIRGGLPAVGRNTGARMAQTRYVLFLDADVELGEETLLRRAVEAMGRKNLLCCTTNIGCRDGRVQDRALYVCNNGMQRIGSMLKPFATGMFMMFEREAFWRLGGFHEGALFAEDYLLSKEVPRGRFAIVPGKVFTSNRRFRKVGHGRMVWMFAKTMMHSWDDAYFLRDQGYWDEAAARVGEGKT